MDENVISFNVTERADACVCGGGGPSLGVLREVQRAYEQRMEKLESLSGTKKLQLQVEVLRSWVSDLVGQNTLLARAVEELEAEATTRLFFEERKHSEKDKRYTCGKVNELKTLNENLHKENFAYERELRKLRKDIQQYEQVIANLKNEISFSKYCTPDVSKKDAEVMAGMCCTGAECGDWEPVKEFNSVRQEEMANFQERIKKMEADLKAAGGSVRALRCANLSLRGELGGARALCAALAAQRRAGDLRAHLKDDLIREMRRQLRHAKAKSKEAAELISVKSQSQCASRQTYDSVTIACVRQQPRRSRDLSPPARPGRGSVASRSLSADGRSPRLVVSGDDLLANESENYQE